MTLIGVEEHWTLPPRDQALRSVPTAARDDSLVLNGHGDIETRLHDVGGDRLVAMDEHGGHLQVLVLAPPGTQGIPAPEAVALSRDANDIAVAANDAHSTGFAAMAT